VLPAMSAIRLVAFLLLGSVFGLVASSGICFFLKSQFIAISVLSALRTACFARMVLREASKIFAGYAPSIFQASRLFFTIPMFPGRIISRFRPSSSRFPPFAVFLIFHLHFLDLLADSFIF
jgi:hypothetical protein